MVRCSSVRWFGLLCIAAGTLWGCREPPAESAEEAYARLLTACQSGDSERFFSALDTETQWSIESVHRDQQEMRKLVLDKYPINQRDRVLVRIPAASEESTLAPRRYFRRLPESAAVVAEVSRRMMAGSGRPIGSLRDNAKTAEVWREGGSIFHFSHDAKGRWGYSELAPQWEQAKLRTLHDLDTVRANAALFRQASERLIPQAGLGGAAGPSGVSP